MDKVSEDAKTRNRKILEDLKKAGLDDYLEALKKKDQTIVDTKILDLELRLPKIGGGVIHIKIWYDIDNTFSSTIIKNNIEEFVVGSEGCKTIKEALMKTLNSIKDI